MEASIKKNILIHAAPALVWQWLTEPARMKTWMTDDDETLSVQTSWQTGSPFVITGFHHIAFRNDGKVLDFDPPRVLSYTHRSSLSHLADLPEHYTVFRFELLPVGNDTELALSISNFPTETIFKHLEFYWGTTLQLIKELVEKHN